jgi:hypothetical protein
MGRRYRCRETGVSKTMSYIGNQPTSVAFLTDQFSGTGSQTAFTLSAAPANTASIIVAVSGVLQDPTTYSTSGLTLTFSAAPPSGTGNISVRFLGIPASNIATTAYRTQTEFTATAGQTTFSVPSYTPGFIDVYRNGVLLGSADYTATSGTTVVLAAGATAGDLVETISFYVSSVLNAIPAVANAVTTAYINDGAVTQSKLGAGVAGNGPAFSAYQSSAQSLTANTATKVQFQTEEFDTASAFDSSTNYRFTPQVAGYYQVNSAINFSSTRTYTLLLLYKNGSAFKISHNGDNAGVGLGGTLSTIVYLNGSTDYLEIYGFIGSTQNLTAAATDTWFQAALIRSA